MNPYRLVEAIANEEPGTLRLRLWALLAHATGTVVMAIAVFSLLRFLWYPDFYWTLAGGSDLFLLICAIDAVLGPLLTFAVFDPAKGKRRLKIDLVFIAAVQLMALLYGLWTVAVARPIYLVYSVDRFNLVRASDLSDDDLGTAEQPQYRRLPWAGPQIIGTREPKTPDEKILFIDSALAGRDRHLMPKTYIPFDRVKDKMLSKARPLDDLRAASSASADLIESTRARFDGDHKDLGFVPVLAQGDWVVVVDRKSADLLAVLPLDGLKLASH